MYYILFYLFLNDYTPPYLYEDAINNIDEQSVTVIACTADMDCQLKNPQIED